MTDLLSALASRPLLCDGAMGTQLLADGLDSSECGMLWNAEHPERVCRVHQAYRQAGCHLITTNTFGGSSSSLARHGLVARMSELNRAGAQNAHQVAEETAWVLGDIGPFGDFLEPLGEMSAGELRNIFRAQANALIEGGADALLVETMVDPAELEIALAAVKDCACLPILATYAFKKTGDTEFRTIMGTSVEEGVERALAAGADVVGANCGTDLTFPDYLELARQLVRAAGKAPVILQPNAGSPQFTGQETVYNATPADMAAIVEPLLDAGVRIIGGCCGTSPAHLAAMGRILSSQS